ncbi:hypothetical protein N7466_011053 [Penicillium verhagenii]|uniref:uncharacterized protein n=1 Tax=Penicillium verhagenii TaxID=1562060 RepID=UPI002545036B|nr:uncharacterized protein N7466_011053 [Penicillium verhagenii]KAJ5917499.1 hypothetical protein N7466_011053 [Penicillium verhagenii]
MSDLEENCMVLEDTLKANNKNFVCPLCLIGWSRADKVFKHCRDNGAQKEDMSFEEKWKSEIHKDLGAITQTGDFRKFRESLNTACGHEIPVQELPVDWNKSGRRSYGSCLATEFIVKYMAPSIAEKYEVLSTLVDNSKLVVIGQQY